jgi:hypothetical protein
MEELKGDGRTHTYHIKERTIPEAYYEIIKTLLSTPDLRTEYDRKDSNGAFIDPPGKDARIMVEVEEPFLQPRFPLLSYSERGKYIAEILGVKDHLVVPFAELSQKVLSGESFEATEWPYSYHQRLTAHPSFDQNGNVQMLNQLEVLLDRIAEDPITRRAVAITAVPEVDLFIKADQPCLREIQFRCLQDENRELYLNMLTRWRSRDGYKAWGDNVLGMTNLQSRFAHSLGERLRKKVNIGTYSEENGSLHIYGQDLHGSGGKAAGNFLEQFPTKEDFVRRSMDKEASLDLTLYELENLKREKEQWRFGEEQIAILDNLIKDFKTGKFTP